MRIFSTAANILRFYDWQLTTIVLALTAIGFTAIYSVDLSRGGVDHLVYFPTQFVAFILGIIVLFVVGSLHISVYQKNARLIYIIAATLLVSVLVFGRVIRGTKGWLQIGSLSFQPAEFAKAAFILAFGSFAQSIGRRFDKIQYIFMSGFLCACLAVLILLQPDLGSVMVMAGAWLGLLLVTVKKKKHLGYLLTLIAIAGVIGWLFFFKDYQRERFLTFLEPDRDPLGAGYNVAQSIIAIGSGNFFGRGLGFGSQSQLRFLPEAQTDFIFSVIAEELGFVGAGLVLVLYFLLLWRLASIAFRSGGEFGAYTVIGIAWLFLIQIILNIGAALGLMPVTGVTLPFLSYGGSSLLINLFLIGIAQSAIRSGS